MSNLSKKNLCSAPGPQPAAGLWRAAQDGVALIIVLILLLVITLLGLGAVRGTTVMQRITGNFYDRSVAFQAAEAGLQAAAQALPTTSVVIARTCGAGGVTCLANPFADSTLPSAGIQTVAAGSGSGQFTTAANAAGSPQYVIENMGNWPDPDSATGYNQTSNSLQYGSHGSSATVVYYRITARSGDPAAVGDRAVVTLQAVYKQ
jgi:type IV pilus assembly protein PilX